MVRGNENCILTLHYLFSCFVCIFTACRRDVNLGIHLGTKSTEIKPFPSLKVGGQLFFALLSNFVVDGCRQRVYCQNLSLLAKLFLDHKVCAGFSLYISVTVLPQVSRLFWPCRIFTTMWSLLCTTLCASVLIEAMKFWDFSPKKRNPRMTWILRVFARCHNIRARALEEL